MNFVGFEDAENLSPPNSVMNTVGGSGGGSGSGSQNDPNHNVFLGQAVKCDPFSFLDDDDDVEHGLIGKPLRSEHAISLEDLVSFVLLSGFCGACGIGYYCFHSTFKSYLDIGTDQILKTCCQTKS